MLINNLKESKILTKNVTSTFNSTLIKVYKPEAADSHFPESRCRSSETDPEFHSGFDPEFHSGFVPEFHSGFDPGFDPGFGPGFDPRFDWKQEEPSVSKDRRSTDSVDGTRKTF